MKKFYFALVTLLSVMFASCSSDDSPISGEEGHLYSITFKVTGHSPRGNAHLINLDGVKFKCEQTGVSQSSVMNRLAELPPIQPRAGEGNDGARCIVFHGERHPVDAHHPGRQGNLS